MQNQDDIPIGLGQPLPQQEDIKVVCYPESQQIRQTNKTNILDGMHRTTPQPQFNDNYRRQSSRVESRQKSRYRNKAVSQNYDIVSKRQQNLLEQIIRPNQNKQEKVEELPKKVKKTRKIREQIKLPPTNSKQVLATEPSQHSKSYHNVHHFNRNQYLNQKIIKDVDRYPIKYKIMCQVFGCKPLAAYEMHKDQAQHIQQQYTKQKGLEYLREGNAKAKYQYVRDHREQRTNSRPTRMRMRTESTAKIVKAKAAVSAPHNNKVKVSKSQKLIKLTNKQAIEGQKVYDRVKKHINHSNEYNHNYFKHITSTDSIDNALVSYLKTKIKRAEVVLK